MTPDNSTLNALADDDLIERPALGGGVTAQQWLTSIASMDRYIGANARADEGERIATYIDALEAQAAEIDTLKRKLAVAVEAAYLEGWGTAPSERDSWETGEADWEYSRARAALEVSGDGLVSA